MQLHVKKEQKHIFSHFIGKNFQEILGFFKQYLTEFFLKHILKENTNIGGDQYGRQWQ